MVDTSYIISFITYMKSRMNIKIAQHSYKLCKIILVLSNYVIK